MNNAIQAIVFVVVFLAGVFSAGVLIGVRVESDRTTQEAVMLMLKDPAPAQEILRSGKCVILLDGGFAPGADLSVTEYKELIK